VEHGHEAGGQAGRENGMSKDVFEAGDPFDDPAWKEAEKPKRRQRTDHYIGCPVAWLKRVLPLVKSKEQLAIAIYLHRRHAVCGSKVFTVPNRELYEELGLSRFAKYRALRYLEKIGAITIFQDGKTVMRVSLLR
jgi:hypothetical protein